MKKLTVSPSQISLFKRCKRAWYLRYVEKVKEPFKPWLRDGLKFHDCIETAFYKIRGDEIEDKYFDSDVIYMVKRAFELGILYVPDNFIIEKKIDVGVSKYASMTGRVDFIDVSNGKIIDHKSVKSMQWALTPDDLVDDLQMNTYGYWYLTKIPKKKSVWFRHNQLNKIDADLSEFAEVKVSKDQVFAYWEDNVKPYVDEIVELSHEAKKDLYLCDTNSCGDYGGCGYKPNCEADKYS